MPPFLNWLSFSCLITITGSICLGSLAAEETWEIPELSAKSAIVIDAKSGTILFEKNADEPRAVASTQKLLTALIVAEKGALEEEVKVEATDRNVEPTRVGIRANAKYVRGDLIKALLVKSGNDVARCLARDNAGGQDEFTAVLNRRARALGMGASYFINAHGLTVEGQHSTARDMAKLAFVVHQNPFLSEAVRTKEFKLGKTDLTNTNQLLHALPFVTGMKTGTTDAAGRCLVSSADYDGREVIAVVLGSTDKAIWKDGEALIRYALRIPANFEMPTKAVEGAAE